MSAEQARLFPVDDDTGDADARDAIANDLDTTLFVEAGAGSGKTHSLVARVVALVSAGVPLGEIAAITFTEKAAAELKDRVRTELQRAAPRDARCAAAVDDVDGAAISTLHAFAQRLLSEHPIEAGLPPAVDVLDEISSQVAFEERWSDFVDQLLADPDVERALLLARTCDPSLLDHLRDVAVQFNDNWDLVEARVPRTEPDPPVIDVRGLVGELRDVAALDAWCTADDDLLLDHLTGLAALADRLESAADEIDCVDAMVRTRLACKRGRSKNWPDMPVAEVRERTVQLESTRTRLLDEIRDASSRRLAAELARFTLDAAERRRADGQLEFHDLLVRARQLLRDTETGAAVRATVRRRYTRLLLDEFQDTDPIQVELAALIAAPPGDDGADQALPWWELQPEHGRLFFVGDPKQSIYRFRRADIGVFLRTRDAFGSDARQLTRNFRSTAPVIGWVNHTFGALISHEPDSQPEYVPLAAERGAAPVGPGVAGLGADPHADEPDAAELRAREAADVVATVRAALGDRWDVSDEPGDWRPARLGDIAILLPARTSLAALEQALDDAGIPYRTESSSLVYNTREIRDLMATLRAVADPTDELSLVTALRSPLFGCGDDDLYTYRVTYGGRWTHQAELPDELPETHPVAVALGYLGELHRARLWLTASEILGRVVRERRLLELGFARGRPRDLWRRVRFVVDQARAFGESEGGSLREFLAWAELQAADSTRVAETVLPETDDDSVRIMTVHASKGLEFPIAIVSGLTTQARRRRGGVQVAFPPGGGYGLRLRADLVTAEFERFRPLDEQMDFDERLRLLYVACTRARDHLVVSLHRAERANEPASRERLTYAELLAAASPPAPALDAGSPAIPAAEAPAAAALPEREAWSDELDRSLTLGARPSVMSATRLATEAAERSRDPGLQKAGRSLDLPPWNKGRYGSAVGRAVHGVLQTIDLATGRGLTETASAQTAAEGIIGREEVVAELCASALRSSVVKEAVRTDHWREMYVGAGVGERLIEGYVDLLYRSDDGLVVVDYKTDAYADDAELATKLAHYRVQVACYALATELATGEPVARCVFVFLDPDGAREVDIDDLPRAVGEVRSLLR